MQRYKLARVRWQVGQTLLPEHFRAQDESLSAEARLHGELSGLPQVGIASLVWSEAMLAEGSLSLPSLTAIPFLLNGSISAWILAAVSSRSVMWRSV